MTMKDNLDKKVNLLIFKWIINHMLIFRKVEKLVSNQQLGFLKNGRRTVLEESEREWHGD